MHIPRNIVPLSSKRAIVMEYVDGIKINDIEGLKKEFGDANKPSQILIEIFARMIF